MKEINVVCNECGVSANVLTCLKKYKKRPNKLCFDVFTASEGRCDFCGKKGTIISVRDFFYPDFSLLEKIKYKLMKNIFLIEEVNKDKTTFGVGLGNPNPTDDCYFECESEEKAKELKKKLTNFN